MRTYVARQGDYLAKIAARFGVKPDSIWNLRENQELKQKRDPSVLAPGDVVRVPDRVDAMVRFSANRDNRYRVAAPSVPMHVRFSKHGEPLKSEDFEVRGMGRTVTGKTDEDGGATIQVRATAAAVEVRFAKSRVSFSLQIGHADPVDTELGVAQRLARLRYLYIPAGVSGPRLRAKVIWAVLQFQRDEGLPETGVLDSDARARLKDRAGY